MLTPLLLAGTLEVYAAASLRGAFTDIARSFERTHPGVKVRLAFAGSQTLAAQIANGAPADVFASASQKNLKGLAYDRRTRHVFALNQLVVSSLKGFNLRKLDQAKRIVLAAKSVPAGGYAEWALDGAGRVYGSKWLKVVRSKIVSRENDVRAVLAKVKLGEADAGIVYLSDDRKGVLLPQTLQPKIEYPIVVLEDSRRKTLAQAFLHTVVSKAGRQALKSRGFSLP